MADPLLRIGKQHDECLWLVEVLEIAGDVPGIHYVGIQVDGEGQLEGIHRALREAGAPPLEIGRTQCCFADSEKNWTADPSAGRPSSHSGRSRNVALPPPAHDMTVVSTIQLLLLERDNSPMFEYG